MHINTPARQSVTARLRESILIWKASFRHLLKMKMAMIFSRAIGAPTAWRIPLLKISSISISVSLCASVVTIDPFKVVSLLPYVVLRLAFDAILMALLFGDSHAFDCFNVNHITLYISSSSSICIASWQRQTDNKVQFYILTVMDLTEWVCFYLEYVLLTN